MEGVVDSSSYPIRTSLADAPLEVARWRPFFAWIVAIPHLVLVYVLQNVAGLLAFISWFAILFTGRIPDGIVQFQAFSFRYQWRTLAYAGGFTETYPPFEFEMQTADDGHHPAVLEVDPPGELSRGLIWIKWLLIIPHAFALAFVGLAAFCAWGIGAWAVLFTGRWPAGIRDFVVGTMRWSNRMYAYSYLLTDEYPPFSTR